MKKRLLGVALMFCALIVVLTAMFSFYGSKADGRADNGETVVNINEIVQLAKAGDIKAMEEKGSSLQSSLLEKDALAAGQSLNWIICAVGITFVAAVFAYVYFSMLKPFDKMKKYAEKIAGGDFDTSLDYQRANYFGEFTWAFDSMRREITKARACEREAIENNKTVIATLSHDIKTPIASIRAYSEGLEACLDGGPEKRSKYLRTIMKKCDEVSALTDDLFIHSLSDLEKLKIYPERTELCEFTREILSEMSGGRDDIIVEPADFQVTLDIDRNRYTQLVENIINNARKYAGTEIRVSFELTEHRAEVHFRDFGGGIPDEDMPFIFEKFYRGKNCGTQQGSGLGLYIVKYIAEQMKGEVKLDSSPEGLEVIVIFLRTS